MTNVKEQAGKTYLQSDFDKALKSLKVVKED